MSKPFQKFFLLAASTSLVSLMGLSACSPAEEINTSNFRHNAEIKDGKLIDSRDNNKYGVALIAGVYWMTDNLRYADSSSMKNLKGNSWCHEDDKDCSKFGRLYSWTAAMDLDKKFNSSISNASEYGMQGICPAGWRLPSHSDWMNLIVSVNLLNGNEEEGTSLKSTETWNKSDSSHAPTNRFGFNAKASGRRNNDGETFLSTGKVGVFWSAKEKDSGTAFGWQLRHDLDVLQEGNFYKDHGLSVRCVADQGNIKVTGALDSSYLEKIPHEYGSLKYEGETYRTVAIDGITWMADNLKLEAQGSHCYNDEKDNCKEYGRLYTFEAAKKVCPEGWRLPSAADYNALSRFVNSSSALRSTSGWSSKASRGLNFWGFDAKPAGGRENGDYFDLKTSAYFWTSTEINSSNASVMWINYYDAKPSLVERSTANEFSVRCVKAE